MFINKMISGLALCFMLSAPAGAELHYRWVEVDWMPPMLSTPYQRGQDITIQFTVATEAGPVYGSWTGPLGGGYAYAIIAVSNGTDWWDPFLTRAFLPATALWRTQGSNDVVMLHQENSQLYGQETHAFYLLHMTEL